MTLAIHRVHSYANDIVTYSPQNFKKNSKNINQPNEQKTLADLSTKWSSTQLNTDLVSFSGRKNPKKDFIEKTGEIVVSAAAFLQGKESLKNKSSDETQEKAQQNPKEFIYVFKDHNEVAKVIRSKNFNPQNMTLEQINNFYKSCENFYSQRVKDDSSYRLEKSRFKIKVSELLTKNHPEIYQKFYQVIEQGELLSKLSPEQQKLFFNFAKKLEKFVKSQNIYSTNMDMYSCLFLGKRLNFIFGSEIFNMNNEATKKEADRVNYFKNYLMQYFMKNPHDKKNFMEIPKILDMAENLTKLNDNQQKDAIKIISDIRNSNLSYEESKAIFKKMKKSGFATQDNQYFTKELNPIFEILLESSVEAKKLKKFEMNVKKYLDFSKLLKDNKALQTIADKNKVKSAKDVNNILENIDIYESLSKEFKLAEYIISVRPDLYDELINDLRFYLKEALIKIKKSSD